MVEATGQSTVTATLSAISGLDTTVTLGFTGTATNIADYTRSGIQIVIPAGSLTGTITLDAVQDLLFEGDETVIVEITGVTNGTESGVQQVTATITDDDTAPTVTLAVLPLTMAEAAGQSTVTATLSAISGLDTTVTLGFTGTATNLADYTRSDTQIVIPAGQLTGTITLTAVQDALDEADETIVVDISSVANGTESGAQQVTATIIDDDPTPTLSINDVIVVEGNSGTTNAVFTVTLSAPSGQIVTVLAASANDTATSPGDYLALPPTTVTFAPGETTQTVTVAVNGDAVVESNESYFVNLTGATNAAFSDSQGLGTIADDDVATVSFAKINDGAETNTPTNGVFRVTQSAVSSTDTVVPYSIAGTATPGAGNDYTTLSGTVTIPAGQTTADIVVFVLNDAVIEDTETVTLTLTGFGTHDPDITLDVNPANLTATVNIVDDDPLIITSPATAGIAENTPATTVVLDVNANPVAGHTLTCSLSGPDSAAFTINSLTGEIQFVTSPNYELPTDVGGDNVYNVTVSVTADFTPPRTTQQNLAITVTPVNDNAPQFVDASPTFSILEGSSAGTAVGAVSATDADLPADSLQYSIVSGNGSGAFSINPNTGAITVLDPSQLDFETTPSFTLNVQVSDLGSPTPLTDNAVVVINVTNVPEEPTITIPNPMGTYHLGRVPAFVSPDSTFTYGDVADPDFSNAQLTVSIVAGRHRRDRLSIFPKGDGAGQINVKGHRVYFSGKQIGTFQGGHGNKHPDLVVTFNAKASTSAVDNLIRRVSFQAKTDVGITRTITMQVTNVGGVDSGVATRDIAVVE